jgi:hypothetical protein
VGNCRAPFYPAGEFINKDLKSKQDWEKKGTTLPNPGTGVRPHSALGYCAPLQGEPKAINENANAAQNHPQN